MTRSRLGLAACFLVALGCDAHVHPVESPAEPETIVVTQWTARSELFMEYPALSAGETSRAAIHVTDLDGFSPVTEGEGTIVLEGESGEAQRFSGPVSRPGIFGVDIVPDQPGRYTMTLLVETPTLRDEHRIGPVTVHPAGEWPEAGDEEEDGGISFLKEQQWTLDFAVDEVVARSLRGGLALSAEVRPRTAGEAKMTAPVAGRIDPAGAIPPVGAPIRKGDVLARLLPRSGVAEDRATLEFAVTEAVQRHRLTVQERERVERLVAAKALPRRRLAEAAAAEATAEAGLELAQARLEQDDTIRRADGTLPPDRLFALRAPLTGVVAESRATPGDSVDEGELLFRLVAVDRVHIVGAVPESQLAHLREMSGAEMDVPGTEKPVPLTQLVSVGQVLDPESRTVRVIFELDNREHGMSVGQSVNLRLFTGDGGSRPAIPSAAVVDDGGRPVVFVQTGGETFERRPVTLGHQDGGFVEVLEGVEPGERVASRGAFLIRLAAMSSTVPAHGHVH